MKLTESGCGMTEIYRQPPHPNVLETDQPYVFLTATGGIGMAAKGRFVVKTIENWIALAYGDTPRNPVMMPPKRERWEEDR